MLKRKNTEEIKRIAELEENKERDDKIINLQDTVIRLQEALIKQKDELLEYRELKLKKMKEKRSNHAKKIYERTSENNDR